MWSLQPSTLFLSINRGPLMLIGPCYNTIPGRRQRLDSLPDIGSEGGKLPKKTEYIRLPLTLVKEFLLSSCIPWLLQFPDSSKFFHFTTKQIPHRFRQPSQRAIATIGIKATTSTTEAELKTKVEMVKRWQKDLKASVAFIPNHTSGKYHWQLP